MISTSSSSMLFQKLNCFLCNIVVSAVHHLELHNGYAANDRCFFIYGSVFEKIWRFYDL